MEKKYAEIINEGKKLGAPVEAINAELKAAGATFHLDADGAVAGWTEEEMAEGFRPPEKEPETVKHLHDVMRYAPDMAGRTGDFPVAEGTYRVTWDEAGRPVKAVRLHG